MAGSCQWRKATTAAPAATSDGSDAEEGYCHVGFCCYLS